MKNPYSILIFTIYSATLVSSVQGSFFPDWMKSWLSIRRNGCSNSCSFSRTNIADNSLLIPDSLKGSLTLAKSANGNLLAGTWQGGHEVFSSENGARPDAFQTWSGSSNDNVWSITKTILGTELIGTPEGVKRKAAGASDYTLSRVGDGAQGSLVLLGDNIFVGTWYGLFLSQDDGVSWVKTPSDCSPYDPTQWNDNPDILVPKPSDNAKYCEESVNHIEILPDGSLVAFYHGYGGAHRLVDPNNPFVESSWESLPSYQDSEPCGSAFCLVQDAAVLNNYLYVTFQSLAMVRLDLKAAGSNWQVVSVDPAIDNLDAMAVHALDGTLYVSTFQYGMYKTSDGTTWEKLSTEGCSDIPYGGLGMEDISYTENGATVKGIVFGTQYGPWFYRAS